MTEDTDHLAAPGGDDLFSSASRRPMVAVIVPAYNEQDAVRDTVQHVHRALSDAQVPHQIVIVNDGSDDETSAKARAAGAQVIDFPDNIGYGDCLQRDGRFDAAKGHEYRRVFATHVIED